MIYKIEQTMREMSYRCDLLDQPGGSSSSQPDGWMLIESAPLVEPEECPKAKSWVHRRLAHIERGVWRPSRPVAAKIRSKTHVWTVVVLAAANQQPSGWKLVVISVGGDSATRVKPARKLSLARGTSRAEP